MNKVILSGRFTKENELEESKESKTKILRNTIAVNRDKTTTDFINVVFLGKTAELVEKYTTKGNRIQVVGALHINNYEDKETKEKKTYTNVLVESVDLIDFKEKENNELPM